MKSFFFLLFFLTNIYAFGQINNSDILVIIVEEEKDAVDYIIDWNEVSNKFQEKLQNIVADRENLKAYYQSLHNIYQNYFLTNPINSKIGSMNDLTSKINQHFNEQCAGKHVLLVSGQLKPSFFQSELNKLVIDYNKWRKTIDATDKYLINNNLKTNENLFSKLVYYQNEITIYGMLYNGSEKIYPYNFYDFVKGFYEYGFKDFRDEYNKNKEKEKLEAQEEIELKKNISNMLIEAINERRKNISGLNDKKLLKYEKRETKFLEQNNVCRNWDWDWLRFADNGHIEEVVLYRSSLSSLSRFECVMDYINKLKLFQAQNGF